MPAAEQPRLEPERRLADGRAAKQPPDVARATLEVLDTDVDLLLGTSFGVAPGRRREHAAGDRGDLPRDAVDRREIGTVEAGLDVEDVVRQREHVGERRSRLEPVGQHHDPAVIRAEVDLALGEDHPARELAAELRLAERLLGAGQERTRQRDRDGRPRSEVPRAADDLSRLALPHVDLAQLQPVGVRVLARLEHLADEELAEVAVDVRNAARNDPVDLAAREDELARELLEREPEVDVLAEPGDRELSKL